MWFYIYDEDIPPARVYSPSLKSPDNVPASCSSYQAEIFFDCKEEIPFAKTLLEETVDKLKTICNFTDEDIVVKDIRFEPYANVTFTHDINNKQIVLDYLKELEIDSIGRFGRWDYLWSDQAFKNGYEV